MSPIVEKLRAPFPAEAISWRVGSTTKDKSKGMALAYIDSRDVMNRLDEACGPMGWQTKHVVSGDSRVTCSVGILECFDDGAEDWIKGDEWIWKSDGAGETDVEGAKGSYSDSFKRAAVMWGVGRYLYDLPAPWVELEARGRTYVITEAAQKDLQGRLQKWQDKMFGGAK